MQNELDAILDEMIHEVKNDHGKSDHEMHGVPHAHDFDASQILGPELGSDKKLPQELGSLSDTNILERNNFVKNLLIRKLANEDSRLNLGKEWKSVTESMNPKNLSRFPPNYGKKHRKLNGKMEKISKEPKHKYDDLADQFGFLITESNPNLIEPDQLSQDKVNQSDLKALQKFLSIFC